MHPYITLILVLSGVGVGLSAYLSIQTLRNLPPRCFFLPSSWCARMQAHSQKSTFGISHSFLGLMLYTSIFLLSLLHRGDVVPFFPTLILISVGFIGSLYFLYLQVVVIKGACSFCLVSLLDFTALFFISLLS